MGLAVVASRAQLGVQAPPVAVEVHLSGGLPSTTIVGLAETAVKESRDRVRAAIQNARLEFPAGRVTVNLAPADLPKDGCRFDLAIALGILAASGQIPRERLDGHEFLGELALSGALRPVQGVLPAAIRCGAEGRTLIVPGGNAGEVALARNTQARAADSLLAVCRYLRDGLGLPDAASLEASTVVDDSTRAATDMAEVRGQLRARRALEIAAAGGHNLLMIGPPGSGKTLLASCLPGVLPPLGEDAALEVAAIASVAGRPPRDARSFRQPPYRAPHHTASAVALVGGGSRPRPGEISLAHQGVLFLDELPEWNRQALEVLREPLESGRIVISRAARQAEFPAAFQLVAAMNPCPCGYAGDPAGRCRCSADAIARYRGRVSGPLLDRIDLHVEVPRLPQQELLAPGMRGESSQSVRDRVCAARQRQRARAGVANARLGGADLRRDVVLDPAATALLEQAAEKLELSARACHRLMRVARTIADLAGAASVDRAHLAEAVSYRSLRMSPSRV
ncbi:YifB family Mg chelatase-like AAA ATPase [Pseudofulvimonas gallinarii]|uniref:Magnesium chelatase family protein n=1 Tax=Pseudofulvimonas gallinarii TaxID=634155 RepID=A0A4S3L0I3_9GAMM|nr:YifB family Mg chelatase-like AAA ATPase [Pseudofulvimonas gallinarii]TCT00334.1 magnesium chelatase family protein [Pseudofulvimonas gallinarii]THD14174.1 ATP-dependent protease [Pseudofulvimonas gallinarii]